MKNHVVSCRVTSVPDGGATSTRLLHLQHYIFNTIQIYTET